MSDNTPQNILRPTPSRRRASKACLACRARKIRCDVELHDTPCTNCSLDRQECVVRGRPKKYRRSLRADSNRLSVKTTTAPVTLLPEPLPLDPLEVVQDVPKDGTGTIEGPSHLDNQLYPNNCHETSCEQSVEETDRGSSGETVIEAAHCPISTLSDFNDQNIFDDPFLQTGTDYNCVESTNVIFSYYSFLESDLLSHISPQDVNFLELQGCFRVPTRPALDEFVREYFLHVHPSLPMINEGEFWEMYMHRGFYPTELPRMSLFVFHAMLFASCSFVSLETIQSLGFISTRSARETYFRKSKLLFDMDVDRDPISTAQGTLLMTYNSSMRSHRNINTFWLGVAIHFAKEADAHRYHFLLNITTEKRNVLKRLWWCCILRDRILSLGVRRPLQITSEAFDFNEVAPLSEEDFEQEIGHSNVYDSSSKRSLVHLLLTLCDLAVSLTSVIMTVYPSSGPPNSMSDQKADQCLRRVESSMSCLNSWFEKATTSFPTPAGIGDAHLSLILYTNLMYMYYYSARLALYNHEVFILAIRSRQDGTFPIQICRTKAGLEDSTAGVTEHLKELIQLKLAKYLPNSVVAYVALPLVLHILDVKLSTSLSHIARKQGRLSIYTEAMKGFKLQYDGTDEVSDFIGKVIDYISIEGPVQRYHYGESEANSTWQSHDSEHQYSSSAPIWTATANDWSDIFIRQPSLYLRISLTIDLSLSKGYFPDKSDFPTTLQSKSSFDARPRLYRIALACTSITEDSSQEIINLSHGGQRPGSEVDSISHEERRSNSNSPLLSQRIANAEEGFNHLESASGDAELAMYLENCGMAGLEKDGTLFYNPGSWADGIFLEGEQFLLSEEQHFSL